MIDLKEKYKWSEVLSVNNPAIDAQPRHLIDLINGLSTEKAENDPEEFASLLSALTNYFLVHFKEEENYMEQQGYPDLEAHKAEHVQFIKKVAMFNIGFNSSIPTGAEFLHCFTVNWLFNHVLKTDFLYRDYISTKLETEE